VNHCRHRRGRLFWRVYLNGLLLLVLAAVATTTVGAFIGRGQMWRSPDQLVAYAAERVADTRLDPARLAASLARAREVFGVEMTVYRDDGTLVATSASAPPPPLDGRRAASLASATRIEGRRFAAPVPGEPRAYLLLEAPFHAAGLARGALFLAAVLLAAVLGSIPLARAIASPLEKLTRAARALGEGDLTVRAGVRAPGEVGELARAFDEMAERIEKLVKEERELLANVSHELRTPLARIRVALDLAAEGDLPAARRYLSEIGTDLWELELLVKDVLTAAWLDTQGRRAGNELALRRERVEPGELLAHAAERFRAAHPDRSLDLRVDGGLPPLEGHAVLLRRLLENLLDNARKYSEPAEPVVLSARAEGQDLLVEVRDRGIGIDAADLPRLFTPFFRTDRSRARGTGGVGLGLTLAKRIVEAHGGSIAVESAPGQGTTIRFRVPGAAYS
jgi:signal transduction histidine kinase